jgi:hypothetical protein
MLLYCCRFVNRFNRARFGKHRRGTVQLTGINSTRSGDGCLVELYFTTGKTRFKRLQILSKAGRFVPFRQANGDYRIPVYDTADFSKLLKTMKAAARYANK